MDPVADYLAFGAAVLRGVLPRAAIDAAADAYTAEFGALSEADMAARAAAPNANRFLTVGEKRYEIAVPMRGGLGAPELFANSALLPVIGRLLGPGFQLNSFTIVVSHPGAPRQHLHRDYGHLFADPALAILLPPYAVSVSLPLVDLDASLGPTGFWPGSQRWLPQQKPNDAQAVAPELARGDALLVDYRTVHAGLPNSSDRPRPNLYLVYSRPWFFDERNHRRRKPIDIAPESLAALAPEVRALLARALGGS